MSLSLKKVVNNLIDTNDFEYDREYSRVARLHKYWSRKPWFIIGEYVGKYSKKGECVLDPFCGSGIIGLESILAGRLFVGYDLNPLATFLANISLNTSYDDDSLMQELTALDKKVADKIMNYYSCGPDKYILYTILGKKNSKDYNAVLSNKHFGEKEKIVIAEKFLNPKIRFPRNLTYPDRKFPKKFYKDRFSYKGVSKVSDMFTKRNLISLAILYDAIHSTKLTNKDLFILAFTNTLLHVSKLKAENVRPLGVNNYWIPDDFIEENVWWRFVDRLNNIRMAKKVVTQRALRNNVKPLKKYKIYNKSSLQMKEIFSNSVDYLITDPPYGDAIQYSELSFIWNCWLGKDFKIEDEVIINPAQNKGLSDYIDQLKLFVLESKRVLKKDKYFTLAFQNKDLKIWIALAELIRDQGMELLDISSYDTFGSPYNKNWAKFSPKSDFYVTFKNVGRNIKPKSGGIYPEEVARDIIDYIGKNNDVLFNLNKAYDLFVAAVLIKVLDGYTIYNYEKLNVESVVKLFKGITNYGNIQTRLFQNI